MFRRDFKLFCGCLLSVLIGTVLLAAGTGLVAAFAIRSAGQLVSPVRVAVVDQEDSVKSRILVHTVSENEMITSAIEPVPMKEEDAMDALSSGEVSGVILLPDGFTGAILSGQEKHGRIVLSDALSAHADVVEKLAAYGSDMLSAGQNGVFAGEELLLEHNAPDAVLNRYYTAVNPSLLSEALSVHEAYLETETVPYLDTDMTSGAFYASCFTVFVLILTGVFFLPLFLRDLNEPVLNRLASCGVGTRTFLTPKLILTGAFRLLLAFTAAAVLTRYGLAGLSARSAVFLAASAVFCTVLAACLTVCFGDGVTASAVFGFAGLFLVGGVIPRQMLPGWLTAAGDLLPFGAARSLLSPAFGGRTDPVSLAAAVCWALLALWLTGVKIRKIRGAV